MKAFTLTICLALALVAPFSYGQGAQWPMLWDTVGRRWVPSRPTTYCQSEDECYWVTPKFKLVEGRRVIIQPYWTTYEGERVLFQPVFVLMSEGWTEGLIALQTAPLKKKQQSTLEYLTSYEYCRRFETGDPFDLSVLNCMFPQVAQQSESSSSSSAGSSPGYSGACSGCTTVKIGCDRSCRLFDGGALCSNKCAIEENSCIRQNCH
jgi:hypothetical protein